MILPDSPHLDNNLDQQLSDYVYNFTQNNAYQMTVMANRERRHCKDKCGQLSQSHFLSTVITADGCCLR